MWCFSMHYTHPPPPQLRVSLENQQIAITMKATSSAATGGVKTGLVSMKSPICREVSFFGLSESSCPYLT